MSPRLLAFVSLLAASWVLACSSEADSCRIVDHRSLAPSPAPLSAEVIVAGLEVPWGMAFLPDGDVLVTERGGALRLVRREEGGSAVLEEAPLATLEVADQGEGGLLGVALAPDFASSRAIFLYRTRADGSENVIERYTLDGAAAPTSATLASVVLSGIPANRNHNGGRLVTGPDGNLWATTGDAQDDQLSRRRDSLAGKVLRMTPTGEPPAGAADRIAVIGVRNSQGLAFVDEEAPRLALVDHGPSGEFLRFGHDELNLVAPGDDIGWPDAHACDVVEGVRAPLLVFREALPPGGVAVREEDGRAVAFVTALGARKLIEVDLATGDATVHLDDTHGRLRDIVVGPDGALWVTTSNCDGRGACPAGGDQVLRLTR